MRSTATWRHGSSRCGPGTRISSRAMNDEPDDGSRWLDLELSQSQGQREQFAVLLRLLRTDRGAPTSARAGERAASVHLADSLAALELDVVRGAGQIADVGAGAGFPGLALAVALPKCEVRLVESALERHLHTFVKIRATPGRFPRRPGVARKRPLGA